MDKNERKRKLVSSIVGASILIAKKGRTFMEPGYINVPWMPILGIRRKPIMFVKEWIENKKRKELADKKAEEDRRMYGIDVEAELTRILTEELNEAIENEKIKYNKEWVNKNILGLD